MGEKVAISSENEKYRRAKRRKEAVSAWLFLLPNFIGFLIITFLPIFATFVLSFTEWDGKSKAAPAALEVSVNSPNPAAQNITIPDDAVIVYEQRSADKRERNITVPFVLNRDVVIPANSPQIYGYLDLVTLRQWSSDVGDDGRPVISPVSLSNLPEVVKKYDLSLSADEYQYIQEGQLFYGENILEINPRFADTVAGLSKDLVIDMKNQGKELGFNVNTDSEVVIPAGTIILADMFIQKIVSIQTNVFKFPLNKVVLRNKLVDIPEPLVIRAGKTATRSVVVQADRNGEVTVLLNNVKYLSEWKQRLSTMKPGTPEYQNAEKEIAVLQGEINTMVRLEGTNLPSDLYVDFLFMKASGNNGFHFVGIKNYKELLLVDTRFRQYFLNTLVFLVEIPIGMAISLIMALAMNQPLKGIVLFRVLFFLPNISNLVAVALLWRWILNPDYGFLNESLRAIGIQNPPQWFADRGWAKVAIIIVDIWKGAGYNMMLYLAGLQGIPHDLYEAAEIDGASPMQQFWKITWPLLGPTHFFILIMGVIGGFQAFGTQYIMTSGGPAGSTTTIVFYIYNHAYKWGHMGIATAIAVILFFFIMVITAIQWRVSEGNVEY